MGMRVKSQIRLSKLGVKTIEDIIQLDSLEAPNVRSCWGGHKIEKEITSKLYYLGLEKAF